MLDIFHQVSICHRWHLLIGDGDGRRLTETHGTGAVSPSSMMPCTWGRDSVVIDTLAANRILSPNS